VFLLVRLHGLFRVTSRMDYMCPRYMGMVRRFLVLSTLVVFCCFTMVAGRLGKMFLCLFVVVGGLFRHCRFLLGSSLFAAKTQTVT
jgi:hypothetical protein